jgi:hypothetical protein
MQSPVGRSSSSTSADGRSRIDAGCSERPRMHARNCRVGRATLPMCLSGDGAGSVRTLSDALVLALVRAVGIVLLIWGAVREPDPSQVSPFESTAFIALVVGLLAAPIAAYFTRPRRAVSSHRSGRLAGAGCSVRLAADRRSAPRRLRADRHTHRQRTNLRRRSAGHRSFEPPLTHPLAAVRARLCRSSEGA